MTGTRLQAGLLPAGSNLDARVALVTPTDGSALWLQYTDPAGVGTIRIGLGRTGEVAAPRGAAHYH